MAYDFTGLTNAQGWLLTRQGWEKGIDSGTGPRRATVDPLIARGLLIEHPAKNGRPGAYEVPMPVHIAWCKHCAEVA